MYQLEWQLVVGGNPIKSGAQLQVIDWWRCGLAAGFQLCATGSAPEDLAVGCFEIALCVNIGGHEYLLVRDVSTPSGPLVVVRLLNKYVISAMDRDRFSSLRNALTTFVEDAGFCLASADELEKIVGPMRELPPGAVP